jgi:hypothetical protein
MVLHSPANQQYEREEEEEEEEGDTQNTFCEQGDVDAAALRLPVNQMVSCPDNPITIKHKGINHPQQLPTGRDPCRGRHAVYEF